MHYHSKSVTTNQSGIHENLDLLVIKHMENDYRKPIQSHNLAAFSTFQEFLSLPHNSDKSLILDSCCGTAMSSIRLAEENPNSLVIGIDQSYHRLNKDGVEQSKPDNCLLLRANCEDFWRLCVEKNIRFKKHYILYPNPWPKSVHLKRRWHGHPSFTVLNKLSTVTELRSNWKLYLCEFSRAWLILTGNESKVVEIGERESQTNPLTLFEKKYSQSGQVLYRLICES